MLLTVVVAGKTTCLVRSGLERADRGDDVVLVAATKHLATMVEQVLLKHTSVILQKSGVVV